MAGPPEPEFLYHTLHVAVYFSINAAHLVEAILKGIDKRLGLG